MKINLINLFNLLNELIITISFILLIYGLIIGNILIVRITIITIVLGIMFTLYYFTKETKDYEKD